MKKNLIVVFAFIALFIFSGCDGYRDGYYNDENRFYLIDQDGFSVSGVPYSCDSGRTYEVTNRDGAFYFYDGDNCDLELKIRTVDSRIDKLFIEDSLGGVEGIRYFCDNGDEGRTDRYGHFYFENRERDDMCTLIL